MAYWDRISMTKPAPEVTDVMIQLLKEQLGNAQSPHRLGSRSAQLLNDSRKKIADLIGAAPAEITFTSNGTEANNMAIFGLAHSAARKRNARKILVSAIEHISVMKPVQQLEKEGFEIQIIPVDKTGRVLREAYLNALKEDVLMVSIQYANPEIGTIQDIPSLSDPARRKGIVFHTDAVDATGWVPVNVDRLNVDALTLSGTTFHGPPGAAALYVRHQTGMSQLLLGGIQERNRRPGLENIPAIAGLGMAAELAMKELDLRMENGRKVAGQLKNGLSSIPDIEFTGDPENRIPGHLSVIIDYVEGEALLLMLDMHGISAASGSSCTAKDLKISPVLMAMGMEHSRAQGSLVFSSSRDTQESDAITVCKVMPQIVEKLRQMSPLWNQNQK